MKLTETFNNWAYIKVYRSMYICAYIEIRRWTLALELRRRFVGWSNFLCMQCLVLAINRSLDGTPRLEIWHLK
jgi:hypothetical protein